MVLRCRPSYRINGRRSPSRERAAINGCTLAELEQLADVEHPMAAPGETGGIPADASRLRGIRDAVVEMARTAGYPSARDTASFDDACARFLCEGAKIPEVEAYREVSLELHCACDASGHRFLAFSQ